MEEKKVVMPPPPKELKNMPPPPPSIKNGNNEKKEPVDSANSETTEKVGMSVSEMKNEDKSVETENIATKKEGKVKHRSSGGVKTFLYWLGFIVSLGALGVLIYLLVK